MNMIDITPVINAVIALLAAGVSVFLIPWIKSKTTDAQRKELREWVKIGVAAAEQLYKGQGRGEEKKKYVLEFLASMGFTVDEEAINAAIEAADVVLMDDDPLKIAKAIRISRKCIGIVYQNIVFALAVKFACLALGALGLANMWAAIFADVGVMVLAVLNAIRALRVHNL